MQSQPSTNRKSNFNVALNGYRGFCALSVFVFHLGNAGVVPWPNGTVLADGAAFVWSSLKYGVEMFFMISGFVILGSLLRHPTLKGFLQDRFVRIYSAWVPALLAVTAVCIVLKMKMFTDVSFVKGLGIFAGNLLLLPPLLPMPLVHQASWSLTYEWVFYISAATGALLLRRKSPQTWAVAAWAILSGLFICLYPRSLFFLTGVIVFSCQPWLKRRVRWLKFPMVSLLVFLVAWHLTGADKAELNDTVFDWLRDGRWVAAVAAFGASLHMFASITLGASRQFAFLGSRALQFVGTISYSFYLWHSLVVSAMKRFAIAYVIPHYGVAIGFVVFFVSSIAVGLLVSWGSWMLFEVKIAQLFRKMFVASHPPRRPSMPHKHAPAGISIDNRMRCLWIARYIPFPMDGGAQVYSANLSQSLAKAGAFVRFLGFGEAGAVPESAAGVEWLAVPGRKRNRAMAALSALPFAAAIDATKTYRSMLEVQLQQPWDAIVLDSYGTGWALDRCATHCNGQRTNPPVLVHVSHNNEEMLWLAMGREARGSAIKRFALRRNATKVATLERRIVRAVDLLTTITDEDRSTLGAAVTRGRSLSITPGYTGPIVSARRITAATPRRVIIMGSFQWVVKQENLTRFVEIADPIFEKQGIKMDVVGDIPKAFLAALQARCRATYFHGFVTDVAPYLARARIGIVPESIGGGFKLKFLDYIFGRVPIATVSQAVAGLSEDLQLAMLKSDSIAGLVSDIVSLIDHADELNRMQERAFALGKAHFDWDVRGKRFLLAIAAIREPAADGHPLGSSPQDAHLPSANLAVG